MWLQPSTTWRSCIGARTKYAEAEGLYKRALAIREQTVGAKHPEAPVVLNNLASAS
jgi:hypothetical protein